MSTLSANGHAHPSSRLLIRLFGELAIEDGARTLGPADLGGARPKQVLEILLAARGHRVPTERIAELLWGNDRPKDVDGSIQTFVSVLRRHLTTDRDRARRLVVTEAEAYRAATDLVELDLDRFDDLYEQSAREPTRTAKRSLEEALALARGDVLEDEPYTLWADDLRNTYRGRVLGARIDAADAALAELDYASALAHSEAAAALDPYSERAQRLQMLALYALDRQHDALELYRGFRRRLDDELGLHPAPETRALEAAILRRDDVHALLPRPITRDVGPREAPSIQLLGRTAELATLEHEVRRALDGSAALIVLEGETGLGKTRLLDELDTALVDARVGRAACFEIDWHLQYVPLAAALRVALAGVRIDPERLPALCRILPELTPEEPPTGFAEVEILEALVSLVTDNAPLVLLLDDLHSADPATVSALSYLRRRCTQVPLAIVATVDRERTGDRHPTLRLEPDLHLRLQPLTASELAPLGIPHLHESTGGSPRFVTQAVAHGSGETLEHALSEALLARCRAEGAYAYRILQAASVLEPSFDPEPLAELLNIDAATLVEELERLCERRILRVDGPRFRFRYGLVRDVLLASLSPARIAILRAKLDRHGDSISGANGRAHRPVPSPAGVPT